jgi:hypothetical protein
MKPEISPVWGADWTWGLPLITLTVVFHAYSMNVVAQNVSLHLQGRRIFKDRASISLAVVGGTALVATILHATEVFIWAAAYLILGASTDRGSAVLYSLEAMTSYGHVNLFLEPHWRMLGSLEALNGWILFRLTTAFLFAVIQQAWPPPSNHGQRSG